MQWKQYFEGLLNPSTANDSNLEPITIEISVEEPDSEIEYHVCLLYQRFALLFNRVFFIFVLYR